MEIGRKDLEQLLFLSHVQKTHKGIVIPGRPDVANGILANDPGLFCTVVNRLEDRQSPVDRRGLHSLSLER